MLRSLLLLFTCAAGFGNAVGKARSTLTAIVPDTDVAVLSAKVTTAWQFLKMSSATDADLLSAVAVVPDWTMIRDSVKFSALLKKIPTGRLVQIPMTGTDTLDLPSIPSRFTVCNVHNAGTAIPEYVLAAVLSWNIQLPKLDVDFRSCGWHPGNKSDCPRPAMHKESKGQTLGIVGYGTIGVGVAERAFALGMRVVAVDHHASGRPVPPQLAWLGNDTMLPRLMHESDFVVIACPLLPSTRGLISEALLREMKATGVLINVARGPIVNEAGLYAALQGRRIGGAVLDVWWQEMLPDVWPAQFDFAALPNVWMTQHTSFNTAEAQEEGLRQMASNFDHLALGEKLENIVQGPGQSEGVISV